MAQYSSAIRTAVKGTVIALVTWLVLYLTKEHLGRTAALILAGVIFLLFALAALARARLRAGGGAERPRE